MNLTLGNVKLVLSLFYNSSHIRFSFFFIIPIKSFLAYFDGELDKTHMYTHACVP
jgi:hypothetical protein